MSFFDDEDEPETAVTPARGRRPAGSGGGAGARRPAGARTGAPSGSRAGAARAARVSGRGGSGAGPDHAAIQQRRLIGAGIALVLVILAAVGINSCQVSALHSSLQNYAISVNSLIGQSQGNSTSLFDELKSSTAKSNPQGMSQQIDQILTGPGHNANSILQNAQNLSVPDQMSTAQNYLVGLLKLRRDGIQTIGSEIVSALGTRTNQDALTKIAAAMANFMASDVLYKNYVAKEIAAQLNANGLAIGGSNGVTISSDQFLQNLNWLQIGAAGGLASALGVHTATTGNPNLTNFNSHLLHGDSLTAVAAGTSALNPNAQNAVPAKQTTFTLSVNNGGQATEYQVKCEVHLSPGGISGSAIIPQLAPGTTQTCSVPLDKSPGTGQYTLKANVDRVPGETNLSNNSNTYSVTFQ